MRGLPRDIGATCCNDNFWVHCGFRCVFSHSTESNRCVFSHSRYESSDSIESPLCVFTQSTSEDVIDPSAGPLGEKDVCPCLGILEVEVTYI